MEEKAGPEPPSLPLRADRDYKSHYIGRIATCSVRNREGKRFALVNAEDWEALIEWLEALEDVMLKMSCSESGPGLQYCNSLWLPMPPRLGYDLMHGRED